MIDIDDLGTSARRALALLREMDMNMAAERAGGIYDDGVVSIDVLCWNIIIDLDQGRMDMGAAPRGIALPLLHYLQSCSDMPLLGRSLSFDRFACSFPFRSAFRKRAIEPLIERFGDDPEGLWEAGRGLSGSRTKEGDEAVILHIFPKLHVTVIVWKGDDEVGGGASMLFDEAAQFLLPPEDLAEVGMILTDLLVRTP